MKSVQKSLFALHVLILPALVPVGFLVMALFGLITFDVTNGTYPEMGLEKIFYMVLALYFIVNALAGLLIAVVLSYFVRHETGSPRTLAIVMIVMGVLHASCLWAVLVFHAVVVPQAIAILFALMAAGALGGWWAGRYLKRETLQGAG